jgi:hypothetical protein
LEYRPQLSLGLKVSLVVQQAQIVQAKDSRQISSGFACYYYQQFLGAVRDSADLLETWTFYTRLVFLPTFPEIP